MNRPLALTDDRRRHAALSSAILTLLLALVYHQVHSFQFILFDDPAYVTENQEVLSGLTLRGVTWAFTTFHATNWHPLTWLSHMIDVELCGPSAGCHHLISAVIHAANSLVLLMVLRRLIGREWVALMVTSIFALHPLHVESVAWVSERKDLLSTLFFFLTIHAYIRYVHAPGWRSYGVVVLMHALGLMSKPMVVTLPFVLLLLDFWPLQRIVPDARPQTERQSQHPLPLGVVTDKLPLLALSFVSCVITLAAQSANVSFRESYGLYASVGNAALSYVRYIGMAIWPVDLAVFYPHPDLVPTSTVLLRAALLLAVTILVLMSLRTRPYLAVGWFWYLGTLVPVIGIVQVGLQGLADRYTYIPLTGLALAAVLGAAELFDRLRLKLAWRAAICIAVCAAMAGVTYKQVRYWSDDVTLWTRATEVTRDNSFAHYKLAVLHRDLGNDRLAETHFQATVEIDPRHAEAHHHLGALLVSRGAAAEGLDHLKQAVQLDQSIEELAYGVARLLDAGGDQLEAARYYRIAVAQDPANSTANARLGAILMGAGDTHEAERFLRAAIAIDDDHAAAHGDLGVLLDRQQRSAEAIFHLERAFELDRRNHLYAYNLGVALERSGELAQAGDLYREALRIEPDHYGANLNLGVVLYRLGSLPAALRQFEKTSDLAPNRPLPIFNAGQIALELGDMDSVRQKLRTLKTLESSYYDELAAMARSAGLHVDGP